MVSSIDNKSIRARRAATTFAEAEDTSAAELVAPWKGKSRFVLQHRKEFLFCQDLHTQFLSFRELASGRFAGDNEIRLL